MNQLSQRSRAKIRTTILKKSNFSRAYKKKDSVAAVVSFTRAL